MTNTSLSPLRRPIRVLHGRLEALSWELRGRPVPPPSWVKQRTLADYGERFGLRTLIETGTYLGETVEALKDRFERIVSIELSPELFERARERFAHLGHVEIVHGDSGEVLPEVLSSVREPSLLWLDGHYSAGITAQGREKTPVLREIEAVLSHAVKGHVMLIDDARCFTGEDGWPSLEQVRAHVHGTDPGLTFEVAADIVRIHPR